MSANEAMQPLSDPDTARALVRPGRGEACLVYKHSPTCGLSSLAHREVTRFLSSTPVPPETYFIDVLDSRAASLAIESETGIRHESPQALFLVDGRCLWHASHRGIQAETLAEAWDKIAQSWGEGAA